MSKLEELIAELEKAAGPSRDFDWRIAQVTNLPEVWPETAFWPPFMAGSKFDKAIPLFTASIDAAVALVERISPLTTMNIRIARDGSAHVQVFAHPEQRGLDPRGQHTIPAIAICIAALKAKLAQEEA